MAILKRIDSIKKIADMKQFVFLCPASECHKQIKWEEDDDKSIFCPHCFAQLMVYQKPDGTYDIKEDKEDELEVNWDLLVHQIINGDVIPVIGEDLVLDGSQTVKQLLIATMSKKDYAIH